LLGIRFYAVAENPSERTAVAVLAGTDNHGDFRGA
jgi:hypothetical protein